MNNVNRSKYLRTDLAMEEGTLTRDADAAEKCRGISYEEEQKGETTVFRLRVENEEGKKLLHKEPGSYVTLSFGKPWLLDEDERDSLSEVLAGELKNMLFSALGEAGFPQKEALKGAPDTMLSEKPLLAVGLGNRRMTADAIGPRVLEKITVTRHISKLDQPLFAKLCHRNVAAFAPGVLGDTGMESAEAVSALSSRLRPRAILAVDALAARSPDRLATTIQLCDSGIHPGSGVGNDRPGLNKETMGVPVIAIGVPMVVDSSTLVYDALESAGIDTLPDSLTRVLENGKSFFVSVKEADAAIEALSDILAAGIDRALAF